MSIVKSSIGLLAIGVAAFTLGGCATHSQRVASAPAPVDEHVAALLARNALHSGNGIMLGAGDRFGQRIHTHHVAMVRARELHEQMVAEVVDDAR